MYSIVRILNPVVLYDAEFVATVESRALVIDWKTLKLCCIDVYKSKHAILNHVGLVFKKKLWH